MKKAPVPWTNQIYQQKGSRPGTTVKDGMLINNTPPESMTLQRLVELNKMNKRSDKVSMMAEAMSIAKNFG